jgi:F0F1-type ATP synthase assembly protein I
MPSDPNADRNDDLTPAEKQAKGFSQQFAAAMELPFVMVGTIVVGGLLGFFLDRWLHTKPFLMLICGALGFFGGVRDVLRRLPNK